LGRRQESNGATDALNNKTFKMPDFELLNSG